MGRWEKQVNQDHRSTSRLKEVYWGPIRPLFLQSIMLSQVVSQSHSAIQPSTHIFTRDGWNSCTHQCTRTTTPSHPLELQYSTSHSHGPKEPYYQPYCKAVQYQTLPPWSRKGIHRNVKISQDPQKERSNTSPSTFLCFMSKVES